MGNEAIDPRDLRRALGCFATGVAIVTAAPPGAPPVGLTINSFASLSLDPPLVLWSLAARSPSLDAFRSATHFVINILAEHQPDLSNRFASPIPEKFNGVAWEPGLGGAPLITGCLTQFECRSTVQARGGDHILFTGQVERFQQSEQEALFFYRGRYLRRGELTAA